MSQVEYVQKRGWNDFHKYHYVTEGDLVAAIRPMLAKVGVVMIPTLVEEERLEGVILERNGNSTLTRVVMEFMITDGKESYMFRIPGHGADKGDKGVYKAMTGSIKYALMKLFLVETGDDPERENPGSTDDTSVTITGSEETAEKGGRTVTATRYQLQRISATMREKGMERFELLRIIEETLGVGVSLPEDTEAASKTILLFLQELSTGDAGLLITAIDAWEPDVATPTA